MSTATRRRTAALVAAFALVVAAFVGWRAIDSAQADDPYVQGCAAWMHEDQPTVSVDEWAESCEKGFDDGTMERRDWMLDDLG